MERSSMLVVALLAAILAACQSGPTAAPSNGQPTAAPPATPAVSTVEPGMSLNPGASAAPTGIPSSQALIAADLATGAITLAESLRFRAWALFWDPRLPERYDGAGSAGEDRGLFDDIRAAIETLGSPEREELERWLKRPTDPTSAYAPTAAAHLEDPAGGATLARAPLTRAVTAAATPPPSTCSGGAAWHSKDWSPNNSANLGFRAWACDTSLAAAMPDLDLVLAYGAKLWPAMTTAVPNGMGLPVPDTTSTTNDGNGKIDLYILEPRATCRPRGNECTAIPGDAGAAASWASPCGVSGFPADGCSGYMLLPRQQLRFQGTLDPGFISTFAHEFFHVLQNAHNAFLPRNWYEEATAAWAEWVYVVDSGLFSASEARTTRSELEGWFDHYQLSQKSLLTWNPNLAPGTAYQYYAWTWPLFQETERGRASVFNTWVALEGLRGLDSIDDSVNAMLSFEETFRDFAVRNSQTHYADMANEPSNLAPDRWQVKTRLGWIPRTGHMPDTTLAPLPRGQTLHAVRVDALNAHYEPLRIDDPDIREIVIDVSPLTGAEHVDLDVIGLVRGDEVSRPDTWKRFRASGPTLTLCFDNPDENVSFIEVVVSNFDHRRLGNDPSPAARVTGSYKVTASTKCRVPDGFEGTFGGTNSRGDVFSASGTFVLDPDSEGCQLGEYCYEFVSGTATWTWGAFSRTWAIDGQHDPGGIQLIINDPNRPERNKTYFATVVVDNDKDLPVANGVRDGNFGPVAWLHVPEPVAIGDGWVLSGSYSHTGCGLEGDCGTQSWQWNLLPVFNP